MTQRGPSTTGESTTPPGGHPLLISLVSAAAYLPWLLLSLPAGALVDRRDRVSLMSRSQVLQAVIVTAVSVLLAAGKANVPVLAVMSFALGCCEVVFANASQAVLPDIVPEALLTRANSAQYTVANTGQQFIGPPVGSLLFAVAVALPFGVDAGSFALSAGLLATLPRRPRAAAAKPPVRNAIADGLRWLGRHRLLRTLAWLLGANAGIFVAIGSSPDAVVLGALLALNGFATTLWSVVSLSLRQRLVPPDLLGRVNSAYRMLGWGLMPLGSLAGGLIARELGVRAAYPVAGALRGIALLAALPVLIKSARTQEGADR
jgi:hypothetical protein